LVPRGYPSGLAVGALSKLSRAFGRTSEVPLLPIITRPLTTCGAIVMVHALPGSTVMMLQTSPATDAPTIRFDGPGQFMS
jgi:hypothetical protein